MKSSKHTVLFICLGNICRSPAAEGIFRKCVETAGMSNLFQIESAGIGNWHVGQLPDVRMRRCGERHGYCFDSRARQFTAADFSRFDYIVVMDDENYREIVSRATTDTERSHVVKMADYLTSHPGYTSIPDPYYGDESDFELSIELLEDAIAGFMSEFV